jgi:hypothetical protein
MLILESTSNLVLHRNPNISKIPGKAR